MFNKQGESINDIQKWNDAIYNYKVAGDMEKRMAGVTDTKSPINEPKINQQQGDVEYANSPICICID